MKIQAYLPVYNEVDILPWALRHLFRQNISVHVIDGWSTDKSYENIENSWTALLLQCPVTIERFPYPDDGIWNCTRMLHHIEELAAQSDADWCYLTDADEFRYPKIPGYTLAERIIQNDKLGCNAIDHSVFSFFCTDDGWTPDKDPEQYFRYYTRSLDMVCRLPQIKCWKNIPGVRVDLASTGGHEAIFEGRRVSPELFYMKHYPYRTPEQARKKIETRLKRRCHEEHAKGFGVHYDEFPPDFPFLWKKEELLEWPFER